MSKESTVIDTLRSARQADDILTRLQEGSIEKVKPSIVELLGDPNWEYGPAKLRATYGDLKYVVATNKRGETLRIRVTEEEDKIILGKVEVFDVAVPSMDVAQEMLETAKSASMAILEDDFDSAAPMLKAMSRSLDVHGDLHRKLMIEMDIQGLQKNRWYHEIVAENFNGEIEIPSLVQEDAVSTDNIHEALDSLASFLTKELSEALVAMKSAIRLQDTKIVEESAQAISVDMKHAVRALNGADRNDKDEMVRVYESVISVTPRLVAGTRFLVKLVNDELSEE